MDFSVQTVCVFVPPYLRVLLLALLAAGVAAVYSIFTALRRARLGRTGGASSVRAFHALMLAVIVAYAVGAGAYFTGSLRAVTLYERENHRVAEAVRRAAWNEAAGHAVLLAIVVVLFLFSVLLWRRVGPRIDADAV